MKAAYYSGNKSFAVKPATEAPKPAAKEVLLKVAYCGVCGTDIHIFHGNMDQRVNIPQVIGHEVSATVAKIGAQVTSVAPGDPVVVRPLQNGLPHPSDAGYTHIGKNLKFIGIDTPGGMQSYWTVPEYTLHKIPKSLSLEKAALVEPLAVACHDVRLADISEGDHAVVLGGGPIGMLVAMVAQKAGAKVLISELNRKRLHLASSLGFAVCNPVEEELVKVTEEFTESKMADVVFEVAGVQAALDTMPHLLRVRGKIVMVAIHPQSRPINLFQFFWKELQMIGARVYEPEDFEQSIALLNNQELPFEQLITAVAPLEEIQNIFESIDKNPSGMKYLLKIND
ncbi:MAG: zinc-dependent alcohol dehydrogenase [Cyclobacteriaceae bacterium]